MPVVSINKIDLATRFSDIPIENIIEFLPYLSLDIESIDDHEIRVEYNPNRPDFANQYGIFYLLEGFFDIKYGASEVQITGSNDFILTDLNNIHPSQYLLGFKVCGKKISHEDIKQIYALMDDLINGIGRSGKKATITMFNYDKINFPIKINGLYAKQDIEKRSEQQTYSNNDFETKNYEFITNKELLPITVIVDRNGHIISTNSIDINKTNKYNNEPEVSNLLILINSVNKKIACELFSILVHLFTLMGFKIFTITTKNLDNYEFRPEILINNNPILVSKKYVNKILGLNLSIQDIIFNLKRCRIDALPYQKDKIKCFVPFYRIDLKSSIDIVEEVALGNKIFNLLPTIPSHNLSGQKNSFLNKHNFLRESLIGLGITEVINFDLVSSDLQYKMVDLIEPDKILRVDKSKSIGHEVLRDSLIPSLLNTLSSNIHEEYPQKIFEIGKNFKIDINNEIKESWNLSVAIAHKNSNYTETKSILQTLVKLEYNSDIETNQNNNGRIFLDGRSADIKINDKKIGVIGEIHPNVLNNFNLRIPVSVFEIELV